MAAKKAMGGPKASVAPALTTATAEPTRGVGKFYYKNGATYDGEWIFDANAEPSVPPFQAAELAIAPTSTDKPKEVRFKDGKGVFKYGEYSYHGYWTKDLVNGEGIFKFASGAIYQGQWKMGSYCGNGTYWRRISCLGQVGCFLVRELNMMERASWMLLGTWLLSFWTSSTRLFWT